jgi:hypothetical protein
MALYFFKKGGKRHRKMAVLAWYRQDIKVQDLLDTA